MTPEATLLVWQSAAHWLENYQDPQTAKTDGESCPLCRAYADDTCDECPVALVSGLDECENTPYLEASAATKSIMRPIDLAPIAAEYTFLVELALGEHPPLGTSLADIADPTDLDIESDWG